MDRSAFWDDLALDLEDPEFLREYLTESIRIATIDTIVNALNEERETANLSKADLARAIGAEPATIRRLFSAGEVNPTVGTLAEVAAALGMRISIVPMAEDERIAVAQSLRNGRPGVSTVEHLMKLRAA